MDVEHVRADLGDHDEGVGATLGDGGHRQGDQAHGQEHQKGPDPAHARPPGVVIATYLDLFKGGGRCSRSRRE